MRHAVSLLRRIAIGTPDLRPIELASQNWTTR
jgi:hypothetical protein